MKSKAVAFKLGHVRGNTMLIQWVVMALNCNVPCHLQQCKCPDQRLMGPTVLITRCALQHPASVSGQVLQSVADNSLAHTSWRDQSACRLCS